MAKKSRYNHFQKWRDGLYIAFNARSGAVGVMTEENYQTYRSLVEKLDRNREDMLAESERELLGQLQFGKFINDDHDDELEHVRFRHNMSRYDQTILGMVIAPTMACNMACEYCFEYSKTGKMNDDVADSLVEFVQKRAANLRGFNAAWYGGEPLLAMDVIERLSDKFMQMARDFQFGYGSSMISNGTLLTPEVLDRLIELKMGEVQVTVDGPGRIHNSKRPLKNRKESFDAILTNLAYAVEKIAVTVRVNVDRSYTVDDIAELLEELERAGLKDRVGIYFGQLEPATEVCSNISESCYQVSDFSQIETDFFRVLLEKGFRIERLPGPILTFCLAQNTNSFLVDPAGYLYRCFNYVGNPAYAMGHVRDTVDYQNANFVQLFAFDPFDDDTCRDCNLLPVCMGGCPARRVNRQVQSEQVCDSWKYNLKPMLEIIAASQYRHGPHAVREQS